MARNEASYTQDCVEAEQLVRSTIMRIITEMPDAGELAQRKKFKQRPGKTPNLGMHVHMSRSYPRGNTLFPPRLSIGVFGLLVGLRYNADPWLRV